MRSKAAHGNCQVGDHLDSSVWCENYCRLTRIWENAFEFNVTLRRLHFACLLCSCCCCCVWRHASVAVGSWYAMIEWRLGAFVNKLYLSRVYLYQTKCVSISNSNQIFCLFNLYFPVSRLRDRRRRSVEGVDPYHTAKVMPFDLGKVKSVSTQCGGEHENRTHSSSVWNILQE